MVAAYPSMPFRVNLMLIFAFSMAALIIMHQIDRRAGGE